MDSNTLFPNILWILNHHLGDKHWQHITVVWMTGLNRQHLNSRHPHSLTHTHSNNQQSDKSLYIKCPVHYHPVPSLPLHGVGRHNAACLYWESNETSFTFSLNMIVQAGLLSQYVSSTQENFLCTLQHIAESRVRDVHLLAKEILYLKPITTPFVLV